VTSPDGAAVVWAGYGYGILDQVFMVTSAIAT
jgi:hypothetical protein